MVKQELPPTCRHAEQALPVLGDAGRTRRGRRRRGDRYFHKGDSMDSTIEEWEESELEDLLRRARHGSREALEELLERTEGIVRNVAKRDLFYGAWGPEQSYENARAGLLHFAFRQQDPVAEERSGGLVKTCVSRYLLSLLRQEIRRRAHERDTDFSDSRVQACLESRDDCRGESPETVCLQKEAHHLICRHVAQLGERERQVIQLHYYDDLSFKEIAARLGCHINTVYKEHRAALRKLKHALAPLRDA